MVSKHHDLEKWMTKPSYCKIEKGARQTQMTNFFGVPHSVITILGSNSKPLEKIVENQIEVTRATKELYLVLCEVSHKLVHIKKLITF